MKKKEGNNITIFSHFLRNSKAILKYIECEYNKHQNNLYYWHNFLENDFIDYETLNSYINYPEYQSEEICDPNKITADSNRLKVIFDFSNKNYSIGNFNSIPISINQCSITDNICIEIKSEEKIFPVNQKNDTRIISNHKNKSNKQKIFKIMHPNSKALKSCVNYPLNGMKIFLTLIKLQ